MRTTFILAKKSRAEILISRSLNENRIRDIIEHEIKHARNVGIDYTGQSIRTFYDGYGDLRFCTFEDVLINPSTDYRMLELMEISDQLPTNHALNDYFSSYTGELTKLYAKIKRDAIIL